MAAGSLPAGEVRVRFSATPLPALAEPDAKAKESVCAKTGTGRRPRTNRIPAV